MYKYYVQYTIIKHKITNHYVCSLSISQVESTSSISDLFGKMLQKTRRTILLVPVPGHSGSFLVYDNEPLNPERVEVIKGCIQSTGR